MSTFLAPIFVYLYLLFLYFKEWLSKQCYKVISMVTKKTRNICRLFFTNTFFFLIRILKRRNLVLTSKTNFLIINLWYHSPCRAKIVIIEQSTKTNKIQAIIIREYLHNDYDKEYRMRGTLHEQERGNFSEKISRDYAREGEILLI